MLIYLGQHRTMGAAAFDGSFAPPAQFEKWEIHPVFPHFPNFRLGQNLSSKALAPLCGVAQILDFNEKFTKISEDDLRKTRRRAAWLTPSKDDNAVLHKSGRKDWEVLIKATPHNGCCGLRRIFYPNRAV